MKFTLLKPLSACLIAGIIVGCSDSPRKAEYKKSTSLPTLEMPPDLISPQAEDAFVVPESPEAKEQENTVTFSDYTKAQTPETATINSSDFDKKIGVLPESDRMSIKKEGSMRWLEIKENPEVVWNMVKKFWEAEGFLLSRENPKTGILETEWKENRADIPQDGLRKYLGKVLDLAYDASTRDKFKVRLERGNNTDITELYLTHQGAQEVAKGDTFVWQNRPADSELEAEMLSRLTVFFGMDKNQVDSLLAGTSSNTPFTTKLMHTGEGQFSLLIADDFEKTWRRVGLGLERVAGCTIEDHDRSQGIYLVYYSKPVEEEGILSKFFKGLKKEAQQEYLVGLVDEQSNGIRVVVLSKNQENQVDKVKEILVSLYQQLR